MNPNDVATLKLTTEGGQQVVGELSRIRNEISDLEVANIKLKSSIEEKNKEWLNNTKLLTQTEKEILRVKKTGESYEGELDKLYNTYNKIAKKITSNTRDIKENEDAIKKNTQSISEYRSEIDHLTRKLDISQLSYNQLSDRASKLRTQLNATSKELYPERWNLLNKHLLDTEKQMGKVAAGSKNVANQMGALGTTVSKVLALMAAYAAVRFFSNIISEAKEWVKVGIDMARSSEGIIAFFKELSGSRKILNDLKSSTDGTISSLDLMKKTIRAKELGVPVQEMATLMEYARLQAQKLGKDVDHMADSIVDGIGRKSTLVLDNLGISATRVQAEVKKTGDFSQAVIKIVNEELEKQGDIVERSSDKKARATVKWEDAQLKVGQKTKWVGETWDEMSGSVADSISDLIGDTRSLTDRYKDQLETVVDLELNSKILAERYDVLKSKSSLTKDEHIEINKIMNTLSATIPGIVSEWDQYGNILSINTDKVYAFIEAEKSRLQYIFRDVIEEAKKNIKEYESEYNKLLDIQKRGEYKSSFGGQGAFYPVQGEALKKLEDDIKKTGSMLKGANEELNRLTGKSIDDQINAQKNLEVNRQKFRSMNKKELDAWIKDEKNAASEYANIAQQIYDQRFGTNPEADLNTKTGTNNSALADIDLRLKEETNRIKKEYAERLLTKEEHDAQTEAAELKAIEERLKLAGLDAKQRADIEQSYYDFKAKLRERSDKEEEKRLQDIAKQREELEKWNEAETDSIVKSSVDLVDNNAANDMFMLLQQRAENLISEQEYQDQLLEIQRTALEEKLRINGLSEDEIRALRQQSLQNQIDDDNKAYQEKLRVAQAYADLGENFASQLGDILTNQMQNTEASTAEFQYNMLMLALDTLRQIVLMATAEAIAREIGSKGILGIATGAAAAAAINLAFAAVKGLIKKPTTSSSTSSSSGSDGGSSGSITLKGKEEGGLVDVVREQDGKPFSAVYDPNKRGFVDSPTVIVGEGPAGRSKEWVATNALVDNPTARPFIELFDQAQRSGRVGTIDMNQLMRTRLAGFASGGFISNDRSVPENTSTTTPIVYNNTDPVQLDVQKKTLQFLQNLSENGAKTILGMSDLDAMLQKYYAEQKRFTKKG